MAFTDLIALTDRQVRELLGGLVTYTPGVGVPVEIRGVFDKAYIRVEGGQAGVSSSSPAVFLKVADLPSDATTDTAARITVSGTQYKIWEAKPDGLGGILLLLHEAS